VLLTAMVQSWLANLSLSRVPGSVPAVTSIRILVAASDRYVWKMMTEHVQSSSALSDRQQVNNSFYSWYA
jgi:hypothetical protein